MNDEKEPMIDIEAIARKITYRPDSRIEQFRALPLSQKSAVFNILSRQIRQDILDDLSFNEAVELLDHLDPRRVHQILSHMDNKKRRARLIGRIKNDRYEKLEHFLQFHPQADISLLHLNYVYLADDLTIGETAIVIEDHLKNTGKIPVVLISNDGSLAGEASLSSLVKERNTSKLRNYVRSVKSVVYNEEHGKVMSLFISSPHEKIIVTDNDGSVLGVVYSDDVIDLFGDQPASSLYNFAGVTQSERPFDHVLKKVAHRYRWLILNLGTAFMAGAVVALFSETISEYVLLAMYMPIVAGMGGNAATQTLAVMVRGITIGEITLKNCTPAVWNEVKAGFINGSVIGTMVFLIALIFNTDLWLGLVAGVSVIASLVLAGFFGSVVPVVLKHFGKDPATSATVFITTATDVLGFLILLGLATWLLV